MNVLRFFTRMFVLYCWVLALHYAMHAQIVDNPSKTGVQQQSIYRTLDFISTNMDASCADTLPMAKEMIAALESDRVNEQTILNRARELRELRELKRGRIYGCHKRD